MANLAATRSSRSSAPVDEFKPKIDLSHISKPGDVLKAITQKAQPQASRVRPPRLLRSRRDRPWLRLAVAAPKPAAPAAPVASAAPVAPAEPKPAPRFITPQSVARPPAAIIIPPKATPPPAVSGDGLHGSSEAV